LRTTTPIRIGALVLTFVLIIGALLLFVLIWAGVAYATRAFMQIQGRSSPRKPVPKLTSPLAIE
jgi:hypothetical protein